MLLGRISEITGTALESCNLETSSPNASWSLYFSITSDNCDGTTSFFENRWSSSAAPSWSCVEASRLLQELVCQ